MPEFAVLIFFMVVDAIVRGLVLSLLWGWFISEPFGVRQISLPIALGIVTILRMFTTRVDDKQQHADLIERLVWSLSIPLAALIMGFIYHLFM